MVSVNQVRHLFVVKGVKEADAELTKVGDVKVKTTEAGDVFLQYMGEGGLLASDLIKKGQVLSAKAVSAESMRKQLKQVALTLDPNINEGNPVAGQDYIVDVMVSNYICMAEESVLVKFGAVHATANMSASDFYKELAKSLVRNFSRDVNKFFKIYLKSTPSEEEVVSEEEVTMHSTPSFEAAGIVIKEQSFEKDYVRGEVPVTTVNFRVLPKTIISDGEEVIPFEVEEDGSGAIEDKTAVGTDTVVTVGNGYEIADTEYFTMGERGDLYRQMGYPNTIRTKYTVDESQEYDVIDINFYFVGRGIDAQKSEKMITLVMPYDSEHTVANSVIGELTTAGITIAEL